MEEERSLNQVQVILEEWLSEMQRLMVSDKEEMKAWDDVNGSELPTDKGREERTGEVDHTGGAICGPGSQR
eukprot:6545669-Karenia_brevis.AAC.1